MNILEAIKFVAPQWNYKRIEAVRQGGRPRQLSIDAENIGDDLIPMMDELLSWGAEMDIPQEVVLSMLNHRRFRRAMKKAADPLVLASTFCDLYDQVAAEALYVYMRNFPLHEDSLKKVFADPGKALVKTADVIAKRLRRYLVKK